VLWQEKAGTAKEKLSNLLVFFLRHGVQGAAEKSGPLNFFAVFSATVWDFDMKFYSFIYGNFLHLTAK